MTLNWNKWVRQANMGANRQARRAQRNPVGRFRPALEEMEKRLSPATFIVNGVVDDTTGDDFLSLREAIGLVNNTGDELAALGRALTAGELGQISGGFGSSDAIQFDSGLNGQTITLTSGELFIRSDLTISGPVATNLTISGGNGRVFEIAFGATVAIDGLTIADGQSDFGGGIFNEGALTVGNCTLTRNSATTQGGAVYNAGTLTVTDCTLSGNSVSDPGDFFDSGDGGGGIFNDGTATVANCTLNNNFVPDFGDGGGIYNHIGTLVVSTSIMTDNFAYSGGGIFSRANADVSGSTLTGNSATRGGGIFVAPGLALTNVSNSIVSYNSASTGGGIMADGTLIISNSTLAQNSAIDGAGLWNGGSTTVTSSTVDNNSASDSGGGIFNSFPGTLTVIDSTLSGNSVSSIGGIASGGGIYNNGTATVTGSTLNNNSTSNFGGGIFNNFGGTLTVSDSTLSGNLFSMVVTGGGPTAGGGIYNDGTATVTGSTLNNNLVPDFGGAIYNQATLILSDSTLTGNSADAGGGIYNVLGTLTVDTSVLRGNSARFGGGIQNGLYGGQATLIVSDSRLTGNIASSGGGIFNWNTASVANSTVDNNSASNDGGGIANEGALTATDCTLSGNSAVFGGGISNSSMAMVTGCTLAGNAASTSGGGIFTPVGLGLTALNNIVAGNTSPIGPDLVGGITTNQGHNLIGNTLGGSGFVASDLLNVNPLLTPLGDFGGPTPTMALLRGSPAIDAGDNANAPATDQRGFARIVNGTIDIGAFESPGLANQTITWTDPAAILSSTALSSTQLNATVEGVTGGPPPGALTYTPDVGTILTAGSHTLRVTAAKTDDYNAASKEVTIQVFDAARISGIAFKDINGDGEVDYGEEGAVGVVVSLRGADMNGQPVNESTTSLASGYYCFDNLLPGNYTVTFVSGGTLTSGSPNHYDVGFPAIGTGGATSSTNNFALAPASGDQLKRGQTAGIGFWQNKNGQALIKKMNGAESSTALGHWLADNFHHMFQNVDGMTDAQIAALYQQAFANKGEKTEAQFFATALSMYVTSSVLSGGAYAASYGFTVTADGARVATFNVGSNGAVVGVANNTTLSIMDIMLALDAQATDSIIGTGTLFKTNQSLRSMATSLLSSINDAGGI